MPRTVALSSPLSDTLWLSLPQPEVENSKTTGITFHFYPVSPVEDQVLAWDIEISVYNHFSFLIKLKNLPLKGALSGLCLAYTNFLS